MSPSKIIHVGSGRKATAQIVTTKHVHGAPTATPWPGEGVVHEHVTLETPKAHSNTAKLRILTLKDAGKVWP